MTPTKNQLREEIYFRLHGMEPQIEADKSRAACRAITELPEFARAAAIMSFMSIPGEIDTSSIAQHAWKAGKTLLVPKITDRRHRVMVAVAIRSLTEDMIPGSYDILEPRSSDAWPLERIDLIVVPAMAFDRRGNRLGRGGGYYDRFLAQPGLTAVRCGIAFEEQILDEVPADPHDRPVDMVATDRHVLRFDKAG